MKKYVGIDWLRAVACIGIMAMHIATNNRYEISGIIYQGIIPSFADFVFLFMAISAFGISCGYYHKVMSGKINWTDFYKKRYIKILPFFLVLIIIDLMMNFSVHSLCEGFVEMTLLHGFIPKSFTVIGVSWFLGIVYVFYLIFPFYCVLIENKRRAWGIFTISIVLNYICLIYFDLNQTNFVCSFCFFVAGGLVYLYKDVLEGMKRYYSLPIVLVALCCYYIIGGNTLTRLMVTIALLVFSISSDYKKIGAVSFISDISMEFYLSHMVIFRGIEKLRLNTVFGNGWGQYLITVALVMIGTVIFSYILKKLIDKCYSLIK